MSGDKSMKKILVLAVAQVAKGTPGTPVPGSNAILAAGTMPKPISGKFVERKVIRAAQGNYGGQFAGEHRVLEFEVEWAGSGAAGTAPAHGVLNLGCKMAETLTAGISAAYQPVGSVGTYLTLYCYLDGVLFTMTDVIGTWSLQLNSEEIPMKKYTFMGVYAPMTDAAFPAGAVYTAFQKPLTVGKVNTPTFSLGGITSLVVKSFSLDQANQNTWRNWIGASGAKSPDRKPVANAVFELTDVATKDWGEATRMGDEMALVVEHGTAAGNICRLAAPKLQISAEPSLSEDNGTALINLQFAVMPNAGNDEFVETFK